MRSQDQSWKTGVSRLRFMLDISGDFLKLVYLQIIYLRLGFSTKKTIQLLGKGNPHMYMTNQVTGSSPHVLYHPISSQIARTEQWAVTTGLSTHREPSKGRQRLFKMVSINLDSSKKKQTYDLFSSWSSFTFIYTDIVVRSLQHVTTYSVVLTWYEHIWALFLFNHPAKMWRVGPTWHGLYLHVVKPMSWTIPVIGND